MNSALNPLENPHRDSLYLPANGAGELDFGGIAYTRPGAASRLRCAGHWWRSCLQAVAVAMMAASFPIFAAASFTLTDVGLPSIGFSSVACADFNRDGKTDVLLTGSGMAFNGICQVWQNQTTGLFTNRNLPLPELSSSAVARGDFDNDGRPDLLLTGFAGVDVNNFPVYVSQVWLNRADGTFTNVQAGLPGVDTGAVALGDFENDGNLDIVITGYSATGAVAQVWRNLGNGTFTNLHAGLPPVFYSSVAVGDYDNDGNLDILLTGTPDGFASAAVTQLWRNLGNGIFSKTSTVFPGVTRGAVAWGDFDGDGKLDILLTGYTPTGAVCQVWRNLGGGSFTNMNVALPGVYQSSVALGDYDNDGKLDILLTGMDNQSTPLCQVWRNTGNWVFTNLNAGLPGIRSGSVSWFDFDNDGRLDFLLSGLDTNGNPLTQVYHNAGAMASATPPRFRPLKPQDVQPYKISFDAPMGFGYTVWASTNFNNWTALGAPNERDPRSFEFLDREAGVLPWRFYRLSRP